MKTVFIDGAAGTTGLRIRERLSRRDDISLLTLPDEERKDPVRRKEALNSADIVFLCLPDAAAKEAVSMIENEQTVVIDTSTAHRTSHGWTYGFAEIGNRYEKIRKSKRTANPGCHASGFIALIAPLVESGTVKKDEQLTAFSLTGYSGGGKAMIAQYEDENRDPLLDAPRLYSLGQNHKHLPEMTAVTGLSAPPLFCPVVAPYYAGMEVIVPVFRDRLGCGAEEIKAIYEKYYGTGKGLVRFNENSDESGFVSAGAFCGRDDMEISVFGNGERILLVSRYDNLGKGASGAAIQNMNIVLGADERTGLTAGI